RLGAAAADQLHHQVRGAAVVADLVDGDDVGVAEAGGGPRLAHEPLRGLGAAGPRPRPQPERDPPLQPRLPRLLDAPPPPPATPAPAGAGPGPVCRPRRGPRRAGGGAARHYMPPQAIG